MVTQHGECTKCHWIVHFNMAKMVNFWKSDAKISKGWCMGDESPLTLPFTRMYKWDFSKNEFCYDYNSLDGNLLSFSVFCISSQKIQLISLHVGCDKIFSRHYLNTKWQQISYKQSQPWVAISCFRRISKILELKRALKITKSRPVIFKSGNSQIKL